MNPRKLKEELGDERFNAFCQALDLSADRPIRSRLHLLEFARNGYQGQDPSLRATDHLFIERLASLSRSIRETQADLRETMEKLTAPPHIPAVFLKSVTGSAWVSIEGRGQRLVGFGDLSPKDLNPGDGVFLSHELNFLIGKMPATNTGHIGRFERCSKGQAVIHHRSEEVLCSVVNGLVLDDLRQGDSVLIDPLNRLAIEKLDDRPEQLPFEVEDVESLTRNDIAGLEPQLESLLGSLTVNLNPGLAGRYRLNGLMSLLLHGSPGCGKTLLAKVAAAELTTLADHRVRFITIRPSEWKDKYVGVTEKKIRDTFQAIRQVSSEAAERTHVIVFMDEVESFGRRRGTAGSHAYVDDFTNALLAELDGFHSLGNVSLITASNRKDLIDPALRERIGSIDIAIPRPKLAAARAILDVHLDPRDPWAGAGARDEAIDAATALIFLGEANKVCKITFNDSSTRTIQARELISGRVLAAIATNARRLAARREARAGGSASGLEVNDLLEATEDAMDSLRTCLSRENAHSYIADLKQDLAIVSVAPLHPVPRRTHSYLNSLSA